MPKTNHWGFADGQNGRVMYDGAPSDPSSGCARRATYRSPICATMASCTREPLSPLVKMTRPDPFSRLN